MSPRPKRPRTKRERHSDTAGFLSATNIGHNFHIVTFDARSLQNRYSPSEIFSRSSIEKGKRYSCAFRTPHLTRTARSSEAGSAASLRFQPFLQPSKGRDHPTPPQGRKRG